VTTSAIIVKKHQVLVPSFFPQLPLRPLAFVDIETTGVDPSQDEIIDIAVMRVDPTTLAAEGWFESRIAPSPDVVFDPGALAINGYNAEDWADAPEIDVVLPQVARFIEGCQIVGHNPAFDWGFLTAAFRNQHMKRPDVGHHLLDTASLAWPLLRFGLVSSLSLNHLCEHYDISNAGEHHALEDVVRTYQLFLRLLREDLKAVLQ
jgi:DNA polymerase-3 subunit epsilon